MVTLFNETFKDIFLIWMSFNLVDGRNVTDTRKNIGDSNIGAGESQLKLKKRYFFKSMIDLFVVLQLWTKVPMNRLRF